MNCETSFWHSFGVWAVPVCRSIEGSEGSSPLGRIFVPQTCIR
jgi:hypothetical protein